MKEFFRRAIPCVLAFVMIFSLAACGAPASETTAAGTDKEKAPEEKAVPEFAYTSEYFPLGLTTDAYITILHFTDDGFYCTYDEVVGEEIPEGAIQEYEGQYWIREARLMFVSYDGETTPVSEYHSIPRPAAGEDQFGYTSSVFLNGLAINGKGNFVVIETVSESWCTKPDLTYDDDEYWDNYMYTLKYYLRELTPDGTELSLCPIETSEDEYISATIILDENGNLLLGGSSCLRSIDQKGNNVYRIDSENYVDSVARTNDGSVYISTYSQKGFNALRKVNTEDHTFGDEIEIPPDAYNFYAGGGDYPLYYTSGQYFYGLDPESGKAEKLFNWIDLDINPDYVGTVGILSDGSVVGINEKYVRSSDGFTYEKFCISKVPYSEIQKKTTLTLATLALDYNVKNAIIEFNRKNPEYRLEIIDYSEYNTDDDINAGLTKLTTELMAGNCPDILDLTNLPVSQLAAKGILEDLYPYIDADPELNREDYFENILAACEDNGRLISTVSGFGISAVVGAKSLVGDKIGWTYDEFNSALAELRDSVPEADPFDVYTTRDSILSSCLGLDMDKFVNWTTGECSFTSQEFIDLLNFSKSFPETFDWDSYDWDSKDSSADYRTAAGLQMLVNVAIYSFDDVFFLNSYFGGKEVTFKGYPTSGGEPGNMIYMPSGLAMTSKGANKDAVWKFLRTFFTPEYQEEIYYLPSSKTLFNEQLLDAMTVEYQKNFSGDVILDENGEKVPVTRMSIMRGDGEIIDFYAVSQEQADKLMEVINSTTKVNQTNFTMYDIVSDQTGAFFAGQKSAEDTAKIIQSKASIYVNEQR